MLVNVVEFLVDDRDELELAFAPTAQIQATLLFQTEGVVVDQQGSEGRDADVLSEPRQYLDRRPIPSVDQVPGVDDDFQGWIHHAARYCGAATS